MTQRYTYDTTFGVQLIQLSNSPVTTSESVEEVDMRTALIQ